MVDSGGIGHGLDVNGYGIRIGNCGCPGCCFSRISAGNCGCPCFRLICKFPYSDLLFKTVSDPFSGLFQIVDVPVALFDLFWSVHFHTFFHNTFYIRLSIHPLFKRRKFAR